MKSIIPAVSMIAWSMLLVEVGQSQLIPDAVSCPRCSIESKTVVQFGEADGPGSLPGRPGALLVDARGRYWVSINDGLPLIFDARGKFVQEVGKRGDGPGEFRHAALAAVIPGDSVAIADLKSITIMGPDLEPGRRIQTNNDVFEFRVLRWPASAFTQALAEDGRGTSLRQIDLSSTEVRITKTILDIPGQPGPEGYAAIFRVLGNVTADHIWIANVSRYRLVRYGSNGLPQDSLERKPGWFPGGRGLGWGSPTGSPQPKMLGLWEDAQGRVWTAAAQPREDYAQAWRGARSMPRGRGVSEVRVSDLPPSEKLWRTVVEVIDPRARRVVARTTLGGFVLSTLPNNRVALSTEDELGIPRITVLELTLRSESPARLSPTDNEPLRVRPRATANQ